MKIKILIAFMFCSLSALGATNAVFSDGLRYFTAAGGGSTNSIISWDDMLFSASQAFKQGVTDITPDNTLGGQAFAASSSTSAANDHLTFIFQTPHRRKTGTALKPHVHFWQTNADQTNGFWISWAFVAIGETNTVETFSGPSTNCVAYLSGTLHQLAEFPDIPGTGKGISSKLRLRLFRNGAIGTGPITVSDFDCHYQVDGQGSDGPASKSY